MGSQHGDIPLEQFQRLQEAVAARDLAHLELKSAVLAVLRSGADIDQVARFSRLPFAQVQAWSIERQVGHTTTPTQDDLAARRRRRVVD